MSTDRDTVRADDRAAVDYAAEAAAMPLWVAAEIDMFVAALGGAGRVRAGDGEHVSVDGALRYTETYWCEPALRAVLADAGWIVEDMLRCTGRPGDPWLSVRARRG
ncbi:MULTISPECIES: hypothetical protein [unclassified Sphingopyxis]|uniref:hypothetical protein n=1 Tax=unclassified Sphingopyxis TaxID=2614943 RepID=UPI000737564D|nr:MULTISPECIES: hypothetical protein [unclassified Sphingopyxis]KTE36522.1 hypothetical protein ATE62_14280 [Sphingopyxis sp. HIX]KTE84522.1 hypothetical protein ATE72_08690 [Sphingopyxis sp. HXXIV]